jgi:hypothetical protein
LKDAKGLAYLDRLLKSPGQDLHVTQLLDLDQPIDSGDAGEILDAKAKETYRRRLEDLKDELEEARRFSDPARERRAQAEVDSIAEQLSQAVGLGGRDRRASSQVERARVNVQRRLRDAIARIKEQSPSVGRYLEATVKTGTYCSFNPM